MSNGPVPSHLCSLSDLPNKSIGDKVRFLGCVVSYEVETATLTLQHTLPRATAVRIAVDVGQRLGSLQSEDIRPGRWLNTIGYVTSISSDEAGERVGIQAIMHWSAHALDVDKYERIVKLESSTPAPTNPPLS